MITVFQAIIIGAIQGITELFPISSLGHSVIIPQLFNWNLNQNQPYFLTFLVATHLATATVLFFFFYKEWIKVIKGLGRSLKARVIDQEDTYAKMGWLLVIATIPAGIIGLLFKDSISKLFASAKIAASFLIVNGIILFLAERLRKTHNKAKTTDAQSDNQISKLSWWQSIGIGLSQSLALIPGISRSGSSMSGSLLSGLDNESAARFSFLLATPIIGAAALLQLPSIFSANEKPIRLAILLGSLAAAVSAYISVKFLIRYFKTKTLTPFSVYCFLGGILYLFILFKFR
ncbi:MAG TPA: undecaprenyl-diphosphate phosphatase [Candidatus Saccharimonadia bacterium]|nr:undecaprenyl-diphosphate phosphatase [Candidatus Saccharimonadia bacterium]